MSRTPFSSRRPQRGGTFRPQLEALDERLAPGGLLGVSPAAADLALAWLQASQQQAATQTTNPVVDFATRTIVFGESTLTRTDDGITMHLTAEGVPAGVYSGWIPLFNPGGTVPVAAGRVAGHVVGEGGKLTFSVHLNEGEIIEGHPVLPRGSLQDAQGQDIGMVARYHGPLDPGRIYEQTHTYDAAHASDFLFTRHNAS